MLRRTDLASTSGRCARWIPHLDMETFGSRKRIKPRGHLFHLRHIQWRSTSQSVIGILPRTGRVPRDANLRRNAGQPLQPNCKSASPVRYNTHANTVFQAFAPGTAAKVHRGGRRRGRRRSTRRRVNFGRCAIGVPHLHMETVWFPKADRTKGHLFRLPRIESRSANSIRWRESPTHLRGFP